MSVKVASLYAEIGAKTDGFMRGSAEVTGGLGRMAMKFATSTAAVAAFQQALNFSIQEASQAQRVDAQLGAVLESTGGSAGMARRELEELATSLSRVSTFDDEAIKSSEALLLTFTKVGDEVFPDATQAILDMSTALGQDLQSSTIQLGKALNDPIAGITALKRVGVSFTEEQRDMIKALVESGDMLGAQKLILQELSTEFGGSALAAANTYEGQVKQLKNEVGNLAEAFGSKLLPVLTDVTGGLLDMARIQNEATEKMESGENTYRRGALYQSAIEEANRRSKDAIEGNTAAVSGQASIIDGALIPSLEDEAEMMREITNLNKGLLGLIDDLQSANERYSENYNDIMSDMSLTDDERMEKLAELREEYDATKNQILSGLLEQKLMQDGILTDDEINWLIAKREEWGIYSAEVANEARAMIAEVDNLTASIANVPTEHTTVFNLITNGAPPNLNIDPSASAAPKGTHKTPHAMGGSFMVPAAYGNEGFRLGNRDTASGGELITITPKGGQNSDGTKEIVAAIMATKLDENKLARLIREEGLKVSR